MELEAIIEEARSAVENANTPTELDAVRVAYMGKKGKITDLMKGLGKLSNEARPAAGQKINLAKQEVQSLISAKLTAQQDAQLNEKLVAESVDVTLPGRSKQLGNLHPVSRTIARIEAFFGDLAL